MEKIVGWILYLTGREKLKISNDDKLKLEKNMNTRGGNFARQSLGSGDIIILTHIIRFEPIKEEVEEIIEPQKDKDTEGVEESVNSNIEDTLKLMKELNSCTHENTTLHRMDTKTGIKYFTVCDFCGRKSRFIKVDSLSEDEINNAKEWVDQG